MGWNSQNVTQLLIINASGGFTGLFVYSPAPGTGNLIASVAAISGTDPYGNNYLQGITSYNPGVPGQSSQLLQGTVILNTSVDQWEIVHVGAGSHSNLLIQNTTTNAPQLEIDGVTGRLTVVDSANSITYAIPESRTDASTLVANTTGLTALTKSWQIPANDPQVGTVYHFTCWGQAHQGTTADGFSWNLTFAGVVLTSEAITAASLPASDNADFLFDARIQITAVGPTGNANLALYRTIMNSTTGAPIVNGARVDITNTIDTTALMHLVFNWQWNAITGAPSATGYGSELIREGQ